MKKNFSKLMFMIAGSLLLMTSCLGDGDTTAVLSNDFVYIGSSNGVKYAMTSAGLVTADELTGSEKLSIGDCAFVALKVNTNNKVGDMYKAEYFTIDDNKIFRKGSQTQTLQNNVFRDSLTVDRMYFKSIDKTECLMYPYTNWGNRVFFTYTYTKRKSDPEARLLVTYSEDQQQDKSGNELSEGQCVLDFELEMTSQGTGVDYETVKKSVVIDLTTFRSIVANRAKVVDVNGTKEGTLDIYFRSFNEKENPTIESQYELIFDTKSGFYFAYSEDELF